MAPAMLSPWSLQDGSSLQYSVTMAFLLLSALTFLSIRGGYLFRRNPKGKEPHLPPCPRGLPLIGNIHHLGSHPHRSLRALSQKHGPVMLLYLGQERAVVVSSAEAAREVMWAQDLVFGSRAISRSMDKLIYGSGNIGFAPYGDHWRRAKKTAVVHLLCSKRVQSFRRLREEEVALMVERVASTSSPATVDVSEVLRSFADSVIKRVVIGSSTLANGDRGRVLRELLDEAGVLMEEFGLEAVLPSVASWLRMLPFMDSRFGKLFERWDAFHNEILDEREQCGSAQPRGGESDFLDLLLSMHSDPLTDFPTSRGVVVAMWTEMVEVGGLTVFGALDWTMAELVRNPGAMGRARREVRAVTGGKPMATEDDVAHMSYLKAVIKEALRLHPPLPLLIPRESMEDARLHGYDIPGRTTVLVNAWAIARDPAYWEAPEEFRPERFLESRVDFRGSDFQFTPFGAGRRICPGINFSMCEVELALANLLHRFDWDLPEGTTVEDVDMAESPGLTCRRKHGLRLVATPYPTAPISVSSSDAGI